MIRWALRIGALVVWSPIIAAGFVFTLVANAFEAGVFLAERLSEYVNKETKQ